MDFEDERGTHLVLQAVWSTAHRGWQRKVYEDEITKVDRMGECIMYFSIEEFVVTGKLRSICRRRFIMLTACSPEGSKSISEPPPLNRTAKSCDQEPNSIRKLQEQVFKRENR